MSYAPGQIPTLPPEVSEDTDDGMNLTKIVVVGVISLVIFALSAVVAWWILRDDTAAFTERGMAPQMRGLAAQSEVGIIDMAHFDSDQRLEVWRAEKAKALSSYGWADRAKGLVHIPIEEAIKDVIRQAGTQAPGGTAPLQPAAAQAPAAGGAPR